MNNPTNPIELMRCAIAVTRQGIADGQSPFGCAIARDNQLLAVNHNVVWRETDITAHAEISAIRSACRVAGNVLLEGAVVVSTCEPCPMCMSALHWARVAKVYYGATIADAKLAGFNELPIAAAQIITLGQSPVQLFPGLLRDECAELFQLWLAAQGRPY